MCFIEFSIIKCGMLKSIVFLSLSKHSCWTSVLISHLRGTLVVIVRILSDNAKCLCVN